MIFLLVGPATNLGSLAIVRERLGGRALIGYLVGVICIALLAALMVDATGWLASTSLSPTASEHEHTNLIHVVAAVLLALAMSRLLIQRLRSRLKAAP